MEKYKYNSYPIGKVPKELQRKELDIIKEMGYLWDDPREVIDMFEQKVADFAGAKYGVLTDCCTNGMFLSLRYLLDIEEIGINWFRENNEQFKIKIPNRTYVSLPMLINQAGFDYEFEDFEWSGIYQLKPTRIYDGAVRWTKDMFVGGNALQVVSFQIKKRANCKS